MVPRARCSLHEGERAEFVNALLAKGFSASKIANLARRQGFRIKLETISAHRMVCLGRGSMAEVEAGKADLAILVRDKVAAELDAMEVSVRDGLIAQQLLDRREETRRDRQFMIGLARLLSGGGGLAPLALVEGDVVEVPGENPLLAPPEARDVSP